MRLLGKTRRLIEARAPKVLIVLESGRRISMTISESSETKRGRSLPASSLRVARGLIESQVDASKANPKVVRRVRIITNVHSVS